LLQLKKRTGHQGSINARVEKHGEEPTPAMDISLELLISAKELNLLMNDPHTVDAWFNTPGGELPEPLFKNLKAYGLKGKFPDSSGAITYGVNEERIEFKNATLTGLSFVPQVGGMTQLKLKLQTLITKKNTDVFLWMDRDVDIELQFGELAAGDAQGDLDLQVGEDGEPLNRHGADEAPAKKIRRRKPQDGATVN
jgi:hypothetical protein